MSDAITQVAHHVEPDFAVIFLKSADGEEHALTFGHHHTKAEAKHAGDAHHKKAHDHHGHDHHSQGKKQHADDVKHQHQHEHGHANAEHAVFNPKHYAVRLFSPLEKAQHNVTGVPRGWSAAKPAQPLSAEGLHKLLKAEWYQEGHGCFVFESEATFSEHVLTLLAPQ